MNPTYCAFPPVSHGDAVVGLEKLRNIVEEIRPLHAAHFAAVETPLHGAPFDPAYDKYMVLEEQGGFVVFTLRVKGELAGYLQYWMFRNMYSRNVLGAKEDAMFISEAHRGKGLLTPFITFAEHCLEQLGCNYIGMSSRGPMGSTDIGPYFLKRGYKAVAEYYVKPLGVADAQTISAKAA